MSLSSVRTSVRTSLGTAKRAPVLQVAKSAIATIAAWLIAGWLIPGPLPVFAAIAALLVVQPSLNQSLGKALERSVGVIAGVVIATGLALFFGQSTWVVLVAVAVGLVIAWALKMTPGTGNQVAISAILVLALGAATPNYALDRVVETIIGALIGIVVNVLIVPPVSVAPAHRAVDALGNELAATLDRLADAFERPQSPEHLTELLVSARLMRPMRDSAEAAINAGRESLTLNPRAGRHRQELAELERSLDRFSPVVTQVIGMTRAFCDHYDSSIAAEPAVRAIGEQLHRAAHDVRLEVGGAPGEAAGTEDLEPALTSPLSVVAPSADHWILIGSLLEDLHRIHRALRETA
ncbi:FUSC family protein [Microbacterium rhizomatis]|uniref:FUSC family protein n=1 Tax=Microbacterium rhizomatis TaxID=1631477 RepID=A0A5J5J7M9_9MICO|nr:FUSC family protein [Microbacterium rhizomatis]KAA9110878.1 FUSC family protein [Microbacterium rhizomatis]